MAAVATSQTLFDGERVAIMKFDFITDTTAEETNVVKVDPAALSRSAAGGACDAVSLLKITGLTNGLAVRMLWDATAPVAIETIPPNTAYTQNYADIGGLTNNAGTGKNGKILFTTIGAASGDTYTVVLEMQKHYVNPMG